MKQKFLSYIIVPVLALTVIGIGTASAHGWFGGWSKVTPEQIAEHQNAMFQHQADILGLDEAIIKQAWSEGKSFKELAEENGLSQEDLQAKMSEQRQQALQGRLQTLVDQGVITQEQANSRLQAMQQKIDSDDFRGWRHGGGMMGCPFAGDQDI